MALKDLITRIRITAKDETAGVFGALQRNAGKVAAAVAGFFTARFFAGSVQDAETLDLQMRKLRATIDATGGAAGLTAEKIDKLARDLDEATLGSAEGFRNAANSLLTFKSIGRDSFGTVLELAADLEAAGFGSLEANAVQLGKALEDPTRGLTALTRSGVTFTAEQEKVIKSLVATGRAAEAQAIILEAVKGQVGGVARAAGTGLSGAIDLVKKRLNDLREQMGKATLPVFQRFNERIAETYRRLADSGVITRFGEVFATAFDAAQKAFFEFVDKLDFDAILKRLASFAAQTRDVLQSWSDRVVYFGKVARVTFAGFGAAFNVIRTGALSTAAALAKMAELSLRVWASVADGVSMLTGRFKGVGNELRNIAQSFAASAEHNFEAATAAANDTQEAFWGTVDAAGALVGVTRDLGEESGKAAESIDEVSAATKSATKETVDANAAIAGMRAEYRKLIEKGDLQGAAEQLERIREASKEPIGPKMELDDAFKELGIVSQAKLQELADNAFRAFESIRTDARATAQDVDASFRVWAERQIRANGGVADSAVRAQAKVLGLTIETTTAGDRIASGLAAGDKALKDTADQAERTRRAIESIGDEAERTGERIAKSARPFGGDSGFNNAADVGSAFWSGPSRIGGTTGALERELRAAATAAGGRR